MDVRARDRPYDGKVRLRVPGRIAWAVAAVAALVVALLALVHTPPAARWSREWIVRQVADGWQLDLATSRVDYNLFTGRVSLTDVRLAAPGHSDAPFFSAARVTVTLPWVIVRGIVRLSNLEVEAGRVLLVRENGTIVNLPPSSGAPPPATARHLDVRGLQVRGLDVDYVDRTGDVDVQVRGLRMALAPPRLLSMGGTSGPITAASITARIGARATTSGAVAGLMSFDGSNAVLEKFTAAFPEATVVADGRINRVLDDVRFALAVTGSLDLAAVAAWTPPPVPVSGPGTFTGTFEGPLGGYELRATFESTQMTIARVPEVALAGVLTLTSPRAVIEPLTITTPLQGDTARRGVFEGAFVYQFGAPGGSDLTGTFRDFDLDMALALYDQDPLTVAAWEQGTVRLGRDSQTAPLRMHATGRSTPLARADRVALDGTWEATLADERWFARHDHQVLDSARAFGTAQWNAGGELSTTAISGPLTLDVSDVGAAIRAARRSGIGMSAALVDVQGTAHGALSLGGTLERTLVTGRVTSSDLVLPTGAAATASADLVYDEDSLGASTFELDTAGARVTGHARMGMISSDLDGAFAAAIEPLPAFLSPFLAPGAPALPVTGRIAITGTIGGTTDVPDVPLRVESTPLTYDTQALGTLDGEARLVGTELRIERLVLDQGPGQLRASGTVDYDSYAYDATIDGRGLTWTRPLPGADVEAVSVDVTFAGAGTLTVPGGSGTLIVTPSGGVGDLVGPADVRWQFVNGTAAISALLPKLRAFAQATVEPTAPYAFRGTALVSHLDVQPLALTAGALADAVTGTVGFSSTFQGTVNDLAAVTGFVNLQDLALSVGGMPLRLERPARVTLRADDFTVDDLALRAGTSTTLTLAGRFRDGLDQPLRASLAGEVSDVTAMARAFGVVPEGTTATGAVSASWESRGGLANARSTLTIANGTVTVAGLPPVGALMAGATFDGSTLVVEQFSAQWQDGQIAGTARVPRELLEPGTSGAVARPGRVDLKVTGLTEQALAPWLPAASLASLAGRVSATLGLDLTTATLAGMVGTLVLDEASVTASGVPIAQSRPGYLSIADGVLKFDDVEFGAGVPVSIGGTIGFVGPMELGVWITGTPGLRPLSVLTPTIAADGAATLDLWITGSPAAPRVTGRIDLDDAEFVMRDPRVIASDIKGPILFEGDRISIPKLTGSLNGGSLEASGAVTLTGLAVSGGEITFQARGVAVEYPRNVDSEIDALLTLSPSTTDPVLHGDVRVLRSSYRATISVPALVAFNATAVTAAAAGPSYLDRVRLDVSLSTEDDMIFDNNYGRFEAGANVRLQGTVAKPGMTGRAELREGGEIFLLGGVYRLNASNIAFTNPAAIEPDMNLSMFTQQGGGEVTVTLSGTLDRLDTSVSSTNPGASTNLLDVLLGGNTSLTGGDALALLSGDLLGVTGRAIGLDALRIERGFEGDLVRQDPGLAAGEVEETATRLTLSKQLRSDVEVILSRELSGNGLTAVVSYRPWRNVELRGTSRDDTDRTYAIRHELSFGGGTVATSAKPRVVVTVAEVRIDGATADEERALRETLRTTPGKRFDFIRWRQDVDRLQSWYHAQGYLEARVRASRTPDAADGRLVLTHRVARGPRTELRISGTEVSRRQRRELEQAWSDGVFDPFRLAEMRGILGYDLVRRNLIGARVDATVSESPETGKVITLAVQGGQQVSSKAIVFAGAQSLAPGELEAALKTYGLDVYVWFDPLSTVDILKARYAEAGFREPVLTPELPVVEGDRGVLHFAVQEGPVTTLSGVVVNGVSDDVSASVADLVRPLEGRAYRDAVVDDARRRIEGIYRAKGYNHVTVTPTVTFSADHAAGVTLTVVPGSEQRLQEVVVDGAKRTKPSAIVTALSLEPGEPVDLAQWAQARKRLYDTNIFRQVDVRPEPLADPRPDGAEAVRARVTVTEWPVWRLRYGVQFNDTNLATQGSDTSVDRSRGLGVVADLQNRNVFGRAFTFGLYGRAERRVQSGSAYLTFPTLFGRAVQTNVFGSGSHTERFLDENGDPTVRQVRTSISLEQRVRRGRAMELVYGYRVIRDEQAAIDPEDPFFLAPVTGRFTGSVLFDRRNDFFDPTGGWFGSFTVERVSEFVSNDDSVKLLGTFYRYQPIGRVTLASAIRIGGSLLGTLRFVDPFFAGGADTVRGYGEDALGPKNFLGAQGGDSLLVLNQEIRAPIYKWLRGVAFIDAGNVFTRNRPSFSGLDVGYGVGIRLHTPFSILRVDMGVPARSGSRRWYFGIGQIF